VTTSGSCASISCRGSLVFLLDEITAEKIDCYRYAKVAEGRIGATSINKTITRLSSILEDAVEYSYISRNCAKGSRRRLKAVKPKRTFLDRADHITALLEAAGTLDQGSRRGGHRALRATLVFAGLRIDEALSLRWRDVDLARATLAMKQSKTDAGIRTVDMLPALRDELGALRASRSRDQTTDLVFRTATGGKDGASNVRNRLLARSVTTANGILAKNEQEPLPSGLTPHSFRRTYASLLVALGEDPSYVMAQMGHTDAKFTLGVYARAMHRRDGERERLARLVSGDAPADAPPAQNAATGVGEAPDLPQTG